MSNAFANETSIDFGEFKHRIWIQKPVTNAAGEPVYENALPHQIWARVDEDRGQEIYAAQQVYPAADALVTFWYRPEPEGGWPAARVVFGTRTYDVLHDNDVGFDHVCIVLTCKKRPAERNT